jgi:tetratricopeptide (TPR) repeat protein
MMKRFILLLCFLVLLTLQDLFPQSKTDSKNSFFDAESWILFEAYKDALPIYLELDSQYPDNANFKYRIGQCYLNSPGEKDKAVPYLEEAVKNIDPDYREGKFSEPGAPYVALYYLANAYRINNKLDKAIEVYRRFKQVLDPGVYDTTVVNRQIQTCLNAKQLIEKPQPLTEHSLGDVINQDNSEYNPVVSDDETMIVFSRIEPFYDALMYSGIYFPPHCQATGILFTFTVQQIMMVLYILPIMLTEPGRCLLS